MPTCLVCGEPVKARNRVYCSKTCLGAAQSKTGYVECRVCGKRFVGKHNNTKNWYCSNECKFADSQEWRKRYIGRAKPKQLELKLFLRGCLYCGAVIVSNQPNAKICGSDECKELQRREYYFNRNPHRRTREHVCVECGATFITEYGNKHVVYCSDKCSQRHSKRVVKATRRARMKTDGIVDNVDPIQIFERDNWICYLCGKEAPRELRGTIDDMAPELEHVIPLSRGGSHTEDNCRCAHRLCNQIKGAALLSEQGDMASAIFPAISP